MEERIQIRHEEARFLRRELINKWTHLLRNSYKPVGTLRQCVRWGEVKEYGFCLNLFGGDILDDLPQIERPEFPVYYDAQGREYAEF